MTKFYIAYALFLVALMVAVAFYQLQLMNQYRPTLQMFESPTALSGVIEGDMYRKGGVVPMLRGHELACGISYLGVSTACREILHGIDTGTPVTTSAVLMATKTGPVWVALAIELKDGTRYATTPENVIREWNDASRNSLLKTPLVILLFFVGVPLLFKFVFKVAT